MQKLVNIYPYFRIWVQSNKNFTKEPNYLKSFYHISVKNTNIYTI